MWRVAATAGPRTAPKGTSSLPYRPVTVTRWWAPTTYTTTRVSAFHSSAPSSAQLFDKILVANRGEIACRVMRTAKKMGIKSVAVYSEADAQAKHVTEADEAVCVGPALSKQSYLNIPAIMDAIKKTGAQAVHPGYGFLSENQEFAKALEAAGVVFIGPTSHAISAMGDKIESKKLATAAKVNVIPGFLGEVHDDEQVLKIAREIGYPVMIKASAGGGGKGMRIAWNDEEALSGFKLSKAEALSSFGDDRMLIEKFIDDPRHVEIQIIADSHGNTFYLPERECSIQRRNQKVIEEAPSPLLSEATRHAMGQQAVALAKAVKYQSAGTVEFLTDQKQNFYFLEMNTRLQVEHPITEYITGLDLVELMIRVAAGEKLDLDQSKVAVPKGWAIESRVYAEDPYRNFLPSIGRLKRYVEPTPGKHNKVRVDSGVEEGDNIGVYYDPLISKLATHGDTRAEAIDRMGRALDTYIIRGLNHNVPFLRSVMENPRFKSGKLSTKFIAEEYPDGFHGHPMTEKDTQQLVASAAAMHIIRTTLASTLPDQLDHAQPDEPQFLVVNVNGHDFPLFVTSDDVSDDGVVTHTVYRNPNDEEDKVVVKHRWTPNKTVFRAQVGENEVVLQQVKANPLGLSLLYCGTQFDVKVQTPEQAELARHLPQRKMDAVDAALRSPMPGLVLAVAVKKGDKVVKGQELCTIEAMKMQNVLRAERDGVVASVPVTPGGSVQVDEVLIDFEMPAAAPTAAAAK